MGGNRKTEIHTYGNLMATFLIGGLWHGGSMTFLAWGFCHGFAMWLHRLWGTFNIKMNKFLAWLITFLFINTTWVLFRAETWLDAIKVLQPMWGFDGVNFMIYEYFPDIGLQYFAFLVVATILFSAVGRNSNSHLDSFQFNKATLTLFALLFGIGFANIGSQTEFLYFAF